MKKITKSIKTPKATEAVKKVRKSKEEKIVIPTIVVDSLVEQEHPNLIARRLARLNKNK